MLEASNLKTMESWYQNLSPYVNDKEFPLRGGKKDLPPVLIGLRKYSWEILSRTNEYTRTLIRVLRV